MVYLVFRNIYVIHDLYMENGAKKRRSVAISLHP